MVVPELNYRSRGKHAESKPLCGSSVVVNETTEHVPAGHACRNGRGFGHLHHSRHPSQDRRRGAGATGCSETLTLLGRVRCAGER
jgi:hypothetical protein